MPMKPDRIILAIACLLTCTHVLSAKSGPKIVNIVNFIRQTEPRTYTGATDEILYETVVRQVGMLTEYGLKGTFLLQYDALINPLYQNLLKNEVPAGTEIGGWWEITEPHVKAAGIEWRGRFPWDWFAQVDFSIGYTLEERERLVDVYMEKFREVFGYYPKSVGSWFIDAYTLNYMYERYGIVASCNCKDQYGTDGYTMWGGYWNQAYYPSKVNAYMPAQDASSQIPVPVFRMLGSDPIYQYDNALDSHFQSVVTLEPSCDAGKDGEWISWYLDTIADGECMAFNYVQAGQENSFMWERMKAGLSLQIPLIKRMADDRRLQVMTLAETGEWFRSRFKTTPATCVTALGDWRGEGNKSIWYDSRYYRANLFWHHDSFRFRDIHLFDQDKRSEYMDTVVRSNKFVYSTLPLVDGYVWSTPGHIAGLRPVVLLEDGTYGPVSVSEPICTARRGRLTVRCATSAGKMTIKLSDERFSVRIATRARWALDLTVDEGAALPFESVASKCITAAMDGYGYSVTLESGNFTTPGVPGNPLRILPGRKGIAVDCRQHR